MAPQTLVCGVFVFKVHVYLFSKFLCLNKTAVNKVNVKNYNW